MFKEPQEIKFRVLEDYGWKFFTLPDDLEDWEGNVSLFYSKENTLCQFTGLKDREEKEIYNKDIVKYYDSSKVWLTSYIYNTGCCFAVKTSENPIQLCEFQKDYEYDNCPIPELEVIGNIYENKELLNV